MKRTILPSTTVGTHAHAESDVTSLTTDLAAKAPLASPAFTGTPTGLTKSHVGLGNVDNTADTAKPVSTATQTALDAKAPVVAARMRSLIVGKYYTQPAFPSTAALTQSRLRVAPYYFDESFTFDRIGTDVTTLAASSTLRWVVYSDATAYPGTLLLDTGAVGDASTTGFKEATGLSTTVSAGRYWIGAVPQGGNPTVRTHAGSVILPGVGLTSAEIVSLAGAAVGFFTDSVTGAAPSTFPAGASASSSAAAVWLRKA